MTVTLTGYGGVGEIGGNAFLLDDGKSRLFLDFGKRFGNDPNEAKGTGHMLPGWGDYFDSFVKPRAPRFASDLMALQIIPELPELYRPDIGGSLDPPGVDGVILSHAHADHAGLIPLLKPDIPVLGSAESWATLRSLEATGVGLESEYTLAKSKGLGQKKDGTPTTSPRYGSGVERALIEDARTQIGDWDITQYPVDHSIHGARGTILEGRDITVAYTGDFRLNGRDGDATKRFLQRAGGADVLITEGTNVSQEHKHDGSDNEAEVEGEIETAMDTDGDGFVGIASPPRDLDRFLSIWNVARRAGRRLVIATKQADMLERMRAAGRDDLPDPRTDAHIAVHLRATGKGVLAGGRRDLRVFAEDLSSEDLEASEWDDLARSELKKWEAPYFDAATGVTSADVAAEPAGHILNISYWTITDLFDIFPQPRPSRPGGLYIHSTTQPFNEEMEINARKLQRWLDAFRLTRQDTHISGHVNEDDLHGIIQEIAPRRLVPIHSMHPTITADKYRERTGQEALLPRWGQAETLA